MDASAPAREPVKNVCATSIRNRVGICVAKLKWHMPTEVLETNDTQKKIIRTRKTFKDVLKQKKKEKKNEKQKKRKTQVKTEKIDAKNAKNKKKRKKTKKNNGR